jgi:hypothetical protein
MARSTVSITSKTASIVVIQAAYERFFSTEREVEVTVNDRSESTTRSELQAPPTFVTPIYIDDWLKFQTLVAQWREQRGVLSSISEAAVCPAYQGIIGMGPIAVPFILAELSAEGDEPDQWFWALKALTGEDPVQEEDRGDFVAMAKSWLEWGKTNPSAYAW